MSKNTNFRPANTGAASDEEKDKNVMPNEADVKAAEDESNAEARATDEDLNGVQSPKERVEIAQNPQMSNEDPIAAQPNPQLNASRANGARVQPAVAASEDEVDNSGKWSLVPDNRFSLDEDARAVRKHLASQDLVKMMIPLNGEQSGSGHYFNIKGFAFYVQKGVYVNVPEDVANMISDTYGQDQRVVDEHPKNLKNNVQASNEFKR